MDHRCCRHCVSGNQHAARTCRCTLPGDIDCKNFGTQESATVVLERHVGDPYRLDVDSDGKACEHLPKAFLFVLGGADLGMLLVFLVLSASEVNSPVKKRRSTANTPLARFGSALALSVAMALPFLILALPFAYVFVHVQDARVDPTTSPWEWAKLGFIWGGGTMAILSGAGKVMEAAERARSRQERKMEEHGSKAGASALRVAGGLGQLFGKLAGVAFVLVLLAAIGTSCEGTPNYYRNCDDYYDDCY